MLLELLSRGICIHRVTMSNFLDYYSMKYGKQEITEVFNLFNRVFNKENNEVSIEQKNIFTTCIKN